MTLPASVTLTQSATGPIFQLANGATQPALTPSYATWLTGLAPAATEEQLTSGAIVILAVQPASTGPDGSAVPAFAYKISPLQFAGAVQPLITPVDLISVEITADTALTSKAHNGKRLMVTVPGVTITGAFADLLDGFTCSIWNVSGGDVVMGGMVNVNGATRLANGAQGWVAAAAWSTGNRVGWGGESTL